jgi:Fic family protein
MGRPRDLQEALNLRKVLLYLMELTRDTDLTITEQMIKAINHLTLQGVPDLEGPPGEYRTDQVRVVNKATDTVLYTPPPAEDVEPLMRELMRDLNGRIGARKRDQADFSVHPTVTAAKACHKLNQIHPFYQGNGRTARALATLILMHFGYIGIRTGDKIRPLKSIEWYFDVFNAAYLTGLRCADNGDDLQWILLFSFAVQETMGRIERDEDLMAVREALEAVDQVAPAKEPPSTT